MNQIDELLYDANKNICNNLEMITNENRGVIAQNMLAQFRTLVEILAVKYYMKFTNQNLAYEWQTIRDACKYLKHNPKLIFLNKFHNCLQMTESHYIQNEDGSEKLMCEYLEYLIEIKKFVKKEGDMDILNKYPRDIDPKLSD